MLWLKAGFNCLRRSFHFWPVCENENEVYKSDTCLTHTLTTRVQQSTTGKETFLHEGLVQTLGCIEYALHARRIVYIEQGASTDQYGQRACEEHSQACYLI